MQRMRKKGGLGLLALLAGRARRDRRHRARRGRARRASTSSSTSDGVSAAQGKAAVEAAGGKVAVRQRRDRGRHRALRRRGLRRRAPRRRTGLEGAARQRGDRPGAARAARAPAGHRAGRRASSTASARSKPRKAKAAKAEPLAGAAVGHGDDRRDRRPARTRQQQGSKAVRVGVIDTGHRRVPPGHRAELRPQAQPQLHDRRPARRRGAATPIRTATAPTRPTSTRAATARTWRARSAPRSTTSAPRGVAPKVELVNLRAGQDSGYFFLGPTPRRADLRRRQRDRRREHVVLHRPVAVQLRRQPGRLPCRSRLSSSWSSRPRSARSSTPATAASRWSRPEGNGSTDLGKPVFDDTSPDYPDARAVAARPRPSTTAA